MHNSKLADGAIIWKAKCDKNYCVFSVLVIDVAIIYVIDLAILSVIVHVIDLAILSVINLCCHPGL